MLKGMRQQAPPQDKGSQRECPRRSVSPKTLPNSKPLQPGKPGGRLPSYVRAWRACPGRRVGRSLALSAPGNQVPPRLRRSLQRVPQTSHQGGGALGRGRSVRRERFLAEGLKGLTLHGGAGTRWG